MKTGILAKMQVKLGTPIEYYLKLGEELIHLNSYVGQKLNLNFVGEIFCCHCKTLIKKTYGDGFCFPCMQKLPQCDLCILKPELCHFAKGTCRDSSWGEKNCFIDHYVYLSNTSGSKIGITKYTQIPTRWIDQGAIQALPILKVSSRHQSGEFEQLFKEVISDKTNWRKMLEKDNCKIDLEAVRDDIFESCGEGLDLLEEEFGEENIEILENEKVVEISYPITNYPEKITALGFDKTKNISGKLLGIKGQYLLFEEGVLNIRKHCGYRITLE